MKKDVICTICNNKKGIKTLDSGQYDLYFCQNCKNGFIYPIPENLSDYYPKLYWQHLGKFSKLRQWLHNSHQKVRVGRFRRYLSAGEVLDVGAGEGVFGEMLGNNFSITNLEYPDAQVKNKSVIKKDFLSWKTSKRFDGIVFLESLEHVPNPRRYLEKTSSLLKKDGVIFVEYPRFSSLESKILGKYWLQRDIPRHLTHFTEEGLRNVAQMSHLKIIIQKGVMSFQYSPYCLLASFVQLTNLPLLNLRKGIIKNLPTLLFLIALSPLAFLLEVIFYLVGESPAGLIVLKKSH